MADKLCDYSLKSLAKYIKDNVSGLTAAYVIGPQFDYDRAVDPNDVNKTVARILPFVTIELISDTTPPLSVSNNRLYEQNIRANISLFDVKESTLRQHTGELKQVLKHASHPITGEMGFMLYDFDTPANGYFADAGAMEVELYQTEYIGPGDVDELDNRLYRSHTIVSIEAKWKDRESKLLEYAGYADFDQDDPVGSQRLLFPATLENSFLAVVFDTDASNKVRLAKIVDKTNGGFTWYNQAPIDLGHSNGLYEIVGTLANNANIIQVLPSATTQFFYASKSQDNTTFTFKWAGITVPDAPESDVLNAILTVSLAPGDNTSKWSLAIERNRGSSFSVDEVHCPILYLKGPVATRAGLTHIESQKRTRLLVPANIPQVIPAQGRNTSLYQLMNFAVETTLGGNFNISPVRFQPMGFNALAAVDSTDTASYLRCFYIAAEDLTGYLKRFIHQGITAIGDTAIYHFRCKQYPSFARGPGLAPTEFANDYIEPPYKVAVGAFKALDEAWWYDVAKRYREFAIPDALASYGLARRELNHLSDIKHGNIMVANIMLGHFMSGQPLYLRFLELQRNIRRALDNPTYAPTLLFSLWQNYLQDGILGTPDYPVSETVDDGVLEAIAQGKLENMLTVLYTQARVFDSISTWMQFFNEDTMAAHDRDHNLIGGSTSSDFNDDFSDDFGGAVANIHVDYGSVEGQAFFPANLYFSLIQLLGPAGFYSDSMSGGWGYLAYDPDIGEAQHLAHGGNHFVQGKRASLNAIRALLNSAQATLMSETPEEGMIGTLDVTHEGLCAPAWHGMLGEELIRDLDVNDVHYEAQHAWPPLWQAVYHSVVPVGRFVMPIYTRVLATTGSPDPTLYPGLTANEWRDIVCYFHALAFVAGSKVIYQHYIDVDEFMPFEMDGSNAITDKTIDPTVTLPGGITVPPAGKTIQLFLRSLHASQLRSFAGQFVVYGTMNRPLPATYVSVGDDGFFPPDSNQFSGVSNPLTAALKVHPSYRDWIWPNGVKPDFDAHIPGLWDNYATALPYNVPCVVHSTWTSPEGIVGLVLVNWTSIERPWQAMFNPALLGIGGPPPLGSSIAYDVHIVSQGVAPILLWSGSGSLLISAETQSPAATHGDFNDDFNDDFNIGAIYIDKIPAHSVKVLTFTPT